MLILRCPCLDAPLPLLKPVIPASIPSGSEGQDEATLHYGWHLEFCVLASMALHFLQLRLTEPLERRVVQHEVRQAQLDNLKILGDLRPSLALRDFTHSRLAHRILLSLGYGLCIQGFCFPCHLQRQIRQLRVQPYHEPDVRLI